MKFKKNLFAAMVLSSGMVLSAGTVLAYEDVTDNTGASEPPRGPGDDSFVEGARPEQLGGENNKERTARLERERAEAEEAIAAEPQTQPTQQTVDREIQSPPPTGLSAEERRRISQEREQRITQMPQRKGDNLGSQASTQNPQDQATALFTRLDQDRDGNLSRDEAQNQNRLDENFADIDADNDGFLSSDELNDWDGIENINE